MVFLRGFIYHLFYYNFIICKAKNEHILRKIENYLSFFIENYPIWVGVDKSLGQFRGKIYVSGLQSITGDDII